MNFDDNVCLAADGHSTECRHCGVTLGESRQTPIARARSIERPSTAAGAGIQADPSHYTDREIVLRQRFCPNCLVLLATEIVPRDDDPGRDWKLR